MINCALDVNECITERHNCSSKATCINEIGSYRCKCNELFLGDGVSCKQVDACYLKYKEKCSVNAVCDETSSEGPECVCNEGYHGDGLNCLRINAPIGLLMILLEIMITDDEPITPVLDNAVTDVPLGIPKSMEIDGEMEETPFMMHNWITDPMKSASEHYNQEQRLQNRGEEANSKQSTTTSPPLAKDYNDVENELYIGGKTMEEADGASSKFAQLFVNI
ncbi:unnamed protein product [Gongylonema pulchrum]|uniref:EGF-like domain-containing protein n=1 Tax=Gongylonema pulchrum TaxID=637853 RepID=A0A3P6QC97_9BILA|nr:unnamed protein product [Gongylonema pulchrum]